MLIKYYREKICFCEHSNGLLAERQKLTTLLTSLYDPTENTSHLRYKNQPVNGGCQVFTVVTTNSRIFWYVTPSSPVGVHERLTGTYCHNLQS
jgi:hypothetical protein